MKISDPQTIPNLVRLPERRSAETSQGKPANGRANDRVTLSPQARELMQAQRLLADIPDIREEKVAEVRERIAKGHYRVDSETIAEKMISEAFPKNK